MEKRYYTYAFLREDGTPYYVGKGHGHRAYKRAGRRCAPPKDKSRIIFLKKDLTEEEAIKHEVYMIAVLGRKDKGTGILRNLTDGGEGITGAKRTEAFCKRMSEVHSGKTISQAHKRAVIQANTGVPLSAEHKQKISNTLKGRKKKPFSKETKEKMRLSAKRRWAKKREVLDA